MTILFHYVAWLYWNPPREAFTIPFLERAVLWYGILFVSGFVLGYFLLVPIFARFIDRAKHISLLDVTDWPGLVQILRSNSEPRIEHLKMCLTTSTQRLLKDNRAIRPSPQLQSAILDDINALLKKGTFSRAALEQLADRTVASARCTAYALNDRLCWFLVIGTLVGARLGEIIFYDWAYFRHHPSEVFKTWHGGLASHGGVFGVVVALLLYQFHIRCYMPQLTFICLLDYVAIPGALAGCMIRLGNFMNQEIVGLPTTLPWGVIFGHPLDGSMPLPSHPVQLYEAAAYMLSFCILWKLWKKETFENNPGALVGLLFIFVFGSRLILEFWKSPIPSVLNNSFLQAGQLLSIPFILLGVLLLSGWHRRFRCNYASAPKREG